MAIKQGREYRALQDFSLVPRDEGSKEYRVRGTAIVFNSPTVLWECDGVEYKEIIDRHAFDECDMSDVIFNYNHGGKVVARLRNKTLALNIDERGVNIDADLGGTTAGRELYEEIDGGYVDKMSFSFTVREASYLSFSKLLVYAVLYIDYKSTMTTLDLCRISVANNYTGSLPYLTALIAFLQAATATVLSFSLNKSKAENTTGGITYDTATKRDC